MAQLIITTTSERILVEPSERIEINQFKTIRSLGFLWSRSNNAFIFNKNIEGAKRIGRLITLTKEDDSMKDLTVIWENDEVKNTIQAMLDTVKAEREQAQAEKKAKEEQANKNRYARFEKIVEQIRQLKNGFSTTKWDLANSNFNLSDLMARSGVRITYNAIDLAKKFNINIEDTDITDSDILELAIRFGNNWRRYSDKPESRYLSFEVSHHTKSTDGFMTGGSGHYETAVIIQDELSRIDFKKAVKISELVNDEVLENIIKNYVSYMNEEDGIEETYNSSGIINGHKYKCKYLETTFKTNCLKALGVNA